MLHVLLPLRIQLLSYSCWDSDCLRFRLWFGGCERGFGLLEVGRAALLTFVYIHWHRVVIIV